jgi:LysM repeat protein
VQAGQSFWSIAIAYKITIRDLKSWNNLSQESTLKAGEKLFIPGSSTAGYATPARPGAVQVSTPDAQGAIIHVVESYQTLSTISQAYGTTVETILAMNGLQVDWPLRIGQKLIIHPSNILPSATLLPVQRLTPASDGRYYHSVRSGETLSWIAGQYGVPVSDLMAWNGLSSSSIIRPDQKLLLLVTPPASQTSSPVPPTETPQPSSTPPVLTATPLPASPTAAATPSGGVGNALLLWGPGILMLALAAGLALYLVRRKIKAGG